MKNTIIQVFSGLITIFFLHLIMFLMDLINFNTIGTENFFGTLDRMGVNFLNIYQDELFNVVGSLVLILGTLYLIYVIVTNVWRKIMS